MVAMADYKPLLAEKPLNKGLFSLDMSSVAEAAVTSAVSKEET